MIQIENVRYNYKSRQALDGVSFSVSNGEIFGLLGPNGSGKSTLFRLLSTLLPPVSGEVRINGLSVKKSAPEVRRKIGIVFQSPSLDGKLTVLENLTYQGQLYGVRGRELKHRLKNLMMQFGIDDRAKEKVEKLSGGLKRRVELAKSLIHQPLLLILDEPSTGLDPAARLELWMSLKKLRDTSGTTIIVTTHLMEEAEECDRIGILNEGRLVKVGTPRELKKEIGGDVLVLKTARPEHIAKEIEAKFHLSVIALEDEVQIEHKKAYEWVGKLSEAFSSDIESITFRHPSLEDVFIHHTGHRFWVEEPSAKEVKHG